MDSPPTKLESKFPRYLDGDVYIIAGVHAWRLHSITISQASDYLKKLFASGTLPKPKAGIKFTLELGSERNGQPNSRFLLRVGLCPGS